MGWVEYNEQNTEKTKDKRQNEKSHVVGFEKLCQFLVGR